MTSPRDLQSSRSMTTTTFHLVLVTLLVGSANLNSFGALGKHIAFFHPTGSYSHRTSLWPLVEKLVANGHHITFISSHLPKNPLPNVTEIVPTQMAKYIHDYHDGGDLDVMKRLTGELERCYDHGPRMGLMSCEKFLEDPVVEEWLKQDLKIDLFVVDWFISECILGLAYKLNAPFIFYAPTVMVGTFYETFGILADPAGVPDFEHHFTPPMTFFERANNAIQPLIWKYKMTAYYDTLGSMLRKKMNLPDMPPLENIVRNASLMMWSESIIEGYPHQLPPNWITVGGMHCIDQTDPVPQELEAIVKKGKNGFILVSFGSAVVPGNLPKSYIDTFFNSIRAFPNIQFLWKWSGPMPQPEEIPGNLHLGKWFPQQDLLAHKRILAFVTQAGRPSTQEAIFHGCPIIAIPVYEDQDYTAERVRDMGGGIVLEIATLTQKQFEDGIREITTNAQYALTMKRLSKLFRDRPMNPVDTAYWWVEYVLRHKGDLSHLRSPSYNLTWYERRLLDVWAFFFAIILLILVSAVGMLILVLKFVCKMFANSVSSTNKSSTKSGDRKTKKKRQ